MSRNVNKMNAFVTKSNDLGIVATMEQMEQTADGAAISSWAGAVTI